MGVNKRKDALRTVAENEEGGGEWLASAAGREGIPSAGAMIGRCFLLGKKDPMPW